MELSVGRFMQVYEVAFREGVGIPKVGQQVCVYQYTCQSFPEKSVLLEEIKKNTKCKNPDLVSVRLINEGWQVVKQIRD